jgi:hypothetical protein
VTRAAELNRRGSDLVVTTFRGVCVYIERSRVEETLDRLEALVEQKVTEQLATQVRRRLASATVPELLAELEHQRSVGRQVGEASAQVELVSDPEAEGGTDWEAANLVAFIYLLLLELTVDQVDRVCNAARGDFSEFTIPPGVREQIARNSVSSLEGAWVRRLEDEPEVASS